jgi:uncharacterized membrane protein
MMRPMLYALLKAIHLLALMLWLGGMVFGNFFLRPASGALAPPDRVRLMHAVLGRFFGAVGVAVLLTLASGVGMLLLSVQMAAQSSGRFAMPLAWTLMAGLGLLMLAIFGHVRFVLHARLARAVSAQDWPAGAAALAQIRGWVLVNLGLGVLIVLVVLLGAAY